MIFVLSWFSVLFHNPLIHKAQSPLRGWGPAGFKGLSSETPPFQRKSLLLSPVYHAKLLTLGDFALRNVTFLSSASASPSVTTVKVCSSTAKSIQILSHGAPGHQANQTVRGLLCRPELSMAVRRQTIGWGVGGSIPQANELESWC